MKPPRKFSELALMLQEARRQHPDAYYCIGQAARIPERRVKAIAYGAEPTGQERTILMLYARG